MPESQHHAWRVVQLELQASLIDEQTQGMQNGDDEAKVSDFIADILNNLITYCTLVQKWNQVIRLVGDADLDILIEKHFIDSLKGWHRLKKNGWSEASLLHDIGSGAGFPGLCIAIREPDLDVVLWESKGRKAEFLRAVKYELNLDNVTIMDAYFSEPTFQKWQEEIHQHYIISRAWLPPHLACGHVLKTIAAGQSVFLGLWIGAQAITHGSVLNDKKGNTIAHGWQQNWLEYVPTQRESAFLDNRSVEVLVDQGGKAIVELKRL